MYRIFCESYENFIKTIDKESYRRKIAEPFELITNMDKYNEERNMQSEIYKKLCDLMCFLKNSIKEYPKLKAFLWTLDSRNIDAKKFGIAKEEDLKEQAKLINSFLKLAYWY